MLIKLAVKVKELDDCYAVISSSIFNINNEIIEIFKKCTGWYFDNYMWFSVKIILPLIDQGIYQLNKNEEYYRYDNDIFNILNSINLMIENEVKGICSYNRIPVECLYISIC